VKQSTINLDQHFLNYDGTLNALILKI